MRRTLVLGAALAAALTAAATIFAPVQGVVHDPQHRPILGARVEVRALASDWSQTATTDDSGQFRFAAVPIGEYTVTITAAGFASDAQRIVVNSGAAPVLRPSAESRGRTSSR